MRSIHGAKFAMKIARCPVLVWLDSAVRPISDIRQAGTDSSGASHPGMAHALEIPIVRRESIWIDRDRFIRDRRAHPYHLRIAPGRNVRRLQVALLAGRLIHLEQQFEAGIDFRPKEHLSAFGILEVPGRLLHPLLDVAVGIAYCEFEEVLVAGHAIEGHRILPALAKLAGVEIAHAGGCVFLFRQLQQERAAFFENVIQGGQLADRGRRAGEVVARALRALIAVGREQKLAARDHELDHGQGPALEDFLVVGDHGQEQRVETADVLHRALGIGVVAGGLAFFRESAVFAHAVVDHAFEGVVERAERIGAVIAEAIEIAGDVFKGPGGVAGTITGRRVKV
jgi:hypothetical protein